MKQGKELVSAKAPIAHLEQELKQLNQQLHICTQMSQEYKSIEQAVHKVKIDFEKQNKTKLKASKSKTKPQAKKYNKNLKKSSAPATTQKHLQQANVVLDEQFAAGEV